MMKSIIRPPALVWTAFIAATAMAQAPAENVLKYVPDNAAMAIVVPSLDKLGSAVSSFAAAIEVPRMPKLDAKAVVESILSETFEHSDGLDTTGTFVLAVVPAEEFKPVFICRLSDPAAWKTNAEKAEEGDLYKTIVQGDDWLAAIKDDVLILCQDESVIRAALSAKGKFAAMLESRSRGLFEKNQVVFLADVPAWKQKIDQSLMMADQMVQFGMMMSAGPQAKAGLDIWQWVSKKFGALVSQTQTAAVGLRFAADGVRLDNLLTFAPDGDVAGYLKDVRKSKGHLLRGIGGGQFAMAAGADWETPAGSGSFIEEMFEVMMKSAATDESADQSKIEAGIKKAIETFRQVSGYSMAMTSASDGGGMLISGAYFSKDAKRLMDDLESMMELNKDVMNSFAMGMKADTTVRKDKIAGQDVTIFDYEFSADDPNMVQGIQMMYGESPAMYMAVKGNELVYAMGESEAAKARITKALGGKSAGLEANTRVRDALGTIPPSPQLLALVDIGEMAKFVMRMAAMSGAEIPPVEIKAAHAPLLAFGGYLDKDAVRGSMFLPAEALRKVLASIVPGGDPDEAD